MKEVVVEKVHRHPEGKPAVLVFIKHFVQRPQQIREQGHHVHKVVEENVVHRKAGEGVKAGTQHRIVDVFDVAAQVKVRAAARHGKFEHEKRHHEVGQPLLREDERKIEERRAVQVERVGIHDAAAKVGGPGEGIAHRGERTVRVTGPLEKAVHIPVKADLLAVEIACIVEKAAVDDIERQEKQRGRQGTQRHRPPEFILFLPQQLRLPGGTRPLHGFLFSLPLGQNVDVLSV